jgi:SAM-dependent methyltransferase
MSEAMAEEMEDEFGAVATWTAEAVLDLGADHALPAACRGSGSPSSLDWLIDRLGLSPEVSFVDAGAGVGGPAEYAARVAGARPVLVEPMEAACRAACRLFGRPVVVGDGASLPCSDASFSVAWSIGVLCTVENKRAHLDEIARVLTSQGRVGLLVYERGAEHLREQPQGNHFPSVLELTDLMGQAGLVVCDTALLTDFPPAPAEWQEAVARVDAWIAERYGDRAAFQHAQRQQSVIRSLIDEELVTGRLIVAQASTSVP